MPLTPILACQEDEPALHDLLMQAYRSYPTEIGHLGPGPYPWLMARIEEGRVYYAGPKTAPHGAFVFCDEETEDTIWLYMVGVAPSMQGKGLGRSLVQSAIEIARTKGKTWIKMVTVPKFARLLAFYNSTGFSLAGYGPHPEGDDGVERAFFVQHIAEE